MALPAPPTSDEATGLPEYLTAAQVGAMLHLSAKSVYRLAKADPTVPQMKLMGTARFPSERLPGDCAAGRAGLVSSASHP